MLETLIRKARSMDASDLHMEAGLPAVFRIRGELETHGKPLDSDALLLAGRSLIGDKNWSCFIEQCSFDLSATIQGVRCRINVMKTNKGVGLAIRLLSSFQPTIKRLNLHPDLMAIAHHSHGLVLIGGATGSGKSSTLAALIQEINHSQAKHIITIENPIEYPFKSLKSFIRQREVGRDTPSFSQGLMDALREDPDVLMIGEIRDRETASNAVQAALTGHLVLSTLHTNDAPSSIARLLDIGIPAFLVSSTVSGIIAQRLLRTICQECKFERLLTEEEMTYLEMEQKPYKVWEGKGCDECRGTGYKGRTGIFEVLEFTERLKANITEQTDMTKIYEIARADGMVSLRELAIQKLLDGQTTFQEIVSVTG